ncbi:hypothetical protein AKJ16_DCAP08940 [Drosera capensis]
MSIEGLSLNPDRGELIRSVHFGSYVLCDHIQAIINDEQLVGEIDSILWYTIWDSNYRCL